MSNEKSASFLVRKYFLLHTEHFFLNSVAALNHYFILLHQSFRVILAILQIFMCCMCSYDITCSTMLP